MRPQEEIKAYTLGAEDTQNNYQSYVQLLNKDFAISSSKDIGLLINIESNFLVNDVNFVLSRTGGLNKKDKNHHIFKNQRQEGQNLLLVPELQAGHYNLIVFAHSCLSNVQGSPETLPIDFDIELSFFRPVSREAAQSSHKTNFDLELLVGESSEFVSLVLEPLQDALLPYLA